MSLECPYVSLVVTSRNDDHGGDLLARMQAFVNGWIGQTRRHGLPSELIVVEWNPPPDRPRLHEALAWPAHMGVRDVRFIEVPREMHCRYSHAEALPLYQMIAKNAGIRRARAPFILATNIDIIFSDEMLRFLSERRLERGKMYRVDRHDVVSGVPVDGSPDEQLEYCRTHLIRLNAREGTFPLTPSGERKIGAHDKAAVTPSSLRKRLWLQWQRLQRLIARTAESPDGRISIQVSPGFKKVAAAYVDCGGVTGAIRNAFRRQAPPAAALVEPRPPVLHTNGCGDFTLMSREDWFDLRGYPQFDLFAMHIDSVLCYAAHYGGIQETVLQDPIRVYHIEHATGSGWTPEGQAKLYERLDAEEIPYLDSLEVVRWGEQMRRLRCPMVFNHDNWGLADYALEESTIVPPAATAV